MSFIRKRMTLIITSVLCLSSLYTFNSCSESGNNTVIPDGTPVTVNTSETETVTEKLPETTEPESPVKNHPDISEVRKRPAETDEYRYSTIDKEECFTVEDGYYKINFLDDKEFESQINSDIKSASDSLKKFFDDSISRKASRTHSNTVRSANGIMADIMVRNGFISILLEYGYYEPYHTDQAGAYSNLLRKKNTVYCSEAVTLNYELTTKNKINDISEFFYDDADWSSELTAAVFREYGGSPAFIPEGSPELFTMDYILVPTEENGFAVVRYNSSDLPLDLCGGMITSHYRSMSGVSSLTRDEYYELYTQTENERCPDCGMNFVHKRFSTSRFYSDSELEQMNKQLEIMYENGFPGKEGHGCNQNRSNYGPVWQYTPESNLMTRRLNIWSCINKYHLLYCFDPYTYQSLSIEDVLGQNWRDYASCEDPETPDVSDFRTDAFITLEHVPSEGKVRASILGYSGVYGKNIRVSVNMPAEEINQRFIPES